MMTSFSHPAMQALIDKCAEVMEKKGRDYSGPSDPLANIKRTAERLGVPSRVVLGTYLSKQVDAVFRYLKDGTLDSEGIESRMVDVVNYVLLLSVMVDESRPRPLQLEVRGDFVDEHGDYVRTRNDIIAMITKTGADHIADQALNELTAEAEKNGEYMNNKAYVKPTYEVIEEYGDHCAGSCDECSYEKTCGKTEAPRLIDPGPPNPADPKYGTVTELLHKRMCIGCDEQFTCAKDFEGMCFKCRQKRSGGGC
jgi:hypothetical protein